LIFSCFLGAATIISRLSGDCGETTLLKGAIFDLGETLMHLTVTWEQLREWRIQAIHDALAEQGADLSPVEVRREWLRLHEEESDYAARTFEEIEIQESFLKLFDRLKVKPEQQPDMDELVKRFFAQEAESWVILPGVPQMLQQVRDLGLKIGLLSNARNDWAVKEIMNRLGLTSYFDVILTSAALGIRKPRPEPFHEMLKLLGVGADEAVMVGNSLEADIAGAKPLGIRTILVKFSNQPDELPLYLEANVDPDTTVSAVQDVVLAIKQMIASN
jgi:HAD superfamily hydrolase (TIGR01509 family)